MGLMRRVPLPVDLDFPPVRRAAGWLGWVLLAAGLAAVAQAVAEYRIARADLAEREAIVARLGQELRRAPAKLVRGARETISAEEAKSALDIAAHLNADWGRMFAAVAAAQSDAATWVGLDGDAPRTTLRIVGEARTLPAALDFLTRLDDAEGIGDARLSSYEWTRSGAVEVVRFNASATWSGRR
jgi:hypothetical protein